MKTIRPQYIGLFSLFIITILSSCGEGKGWHMEEGMVWHTIWRATYEGTPEMMTAAMDSIDAVSGSLSAFEQNSTISRINEADSMPVDAHIRKVHEMSLLVNVRSDGMFDPTLSPLIQAWGFGQGHTPTADTARIEDLLAKTGIRKTRIEDELMLKESPEISFNFSAIAKGYGVDKAAEAMEVQGCKNFMIEIGGEIACRGHNPKGREWRILIETPDKEFLEKNFSPESRPQFQDQIVVTLKDEALATSGNYRNFYERNGGTYGHTISPKTGRPVKTDILSASVIAPTCMEADAMATACMALGSERAMSMLKTAKLPGLFILDTGEVVSNSLMHKHITNNI